MPFPVPSDPYQVQLDVFSGPLDLLLYLVRKEEIEIYDLSLERLTAQFMEYLETNLDRLDLDVAGDFVATAANLIYLKSRRLLPPEQRPAGGDAEGTEGEEEDPRWELIRQLLEYKKFKEAAGHLLEREAARLDLFARPEPAAREDARAAAEALAALEGGRNLGEVSVLDLIAAFQRVLRRVAARQAEAGVQTVLAEAFTVADKIEELLTLTGEEGARGAPVRFERLFERARSRAEVVVTFLALLELVRLRRLRVAQSDPFADIEIYRQTEFNFSRTA